MAIDASEEDAKALAFASEKIKELTEGKTLRKVIYVPGKIMNLVVS
jgi:leucyl-tRNA synthetase